jgi:hypothetical protein
MSTTVPMVFPDAGGCDVGTAACSAATGAANSSAAAKIKKRRVRRIIKVDSTTDP